MEQGSFPGGEEAALSREFDQNAPVDMGHYLDSQFPNSQLTVVPDGGHFSTINNHIGAIFDFVTG